MNPKGQGPVPLTPGSRPAVQAPPAEGTPANPQAGAPPPPAGRVWAEHSPTGTGTPPRAPQEPVRRAPGHTTLIDARFLTPPEPAPKPAVEPSPQAKLKPVVGWLVVTAGPGRGMVFPLQYGVNTVGSHVGEGIRLNFGDLQIADTQAAIIYDYQRRQFFIRPKGGRVATFLDGEPVLKLTPLKSHQEIVMGRTQLRFVPLCGPEFDWTQK